MTNNLNLRYCVENLSKNPGAEIIRYARRKPDILSLAQGEGDAATPDFIADGARRALDDGKTFYGPVLGLEEMRQEVSNYYSRLYNLNMPTNRIYMTGSGTTAMHFALTAILNPGDEVVAVTPIWKNLLGAIELAQAKCKEVALREIDGRWELDMDKLMSACTKNTRAILVTSPSNPTGWVMSRDEIRDLLEFARSKGIWIISDEVYARLTYDTPAAPSFLEQADPEDRLFTINSFSKAWAMTGWRLGWLTGPAAVEPIIQDIALYNSLSPNAFTQYGAIEALRHGEDFLQQQLDLWQSNLDYVYERFAAIGRVASEKPQSTFYAFFRVDGEKDCLNFARRLVDDVSLSLAPGCAFGKVGQGYMRLCFAVSRAKLENALDRLERGIKT
ncbi:MAG: pyridoxal phosphate-dependent aminotransferase [Rhodospirillales bacterium]|nr:pyridoxal phosphate-dependent aminotransferase [Rhodospirillales bacterium]MCB9996174.1 pyridoxal phosphate-dependent aminotransferase [Rhodospirillales bacterium]